MIPGGPLGAYPKHKQKQDDRHRQNTDKDETAAQTCFHDDNCNMEIVEDISKILLWLMVFHLNVALAQGTAHPILEFTYKTIVICIILMSGTQLLENQQ